MIIAKDDNVEYEHEYIKKRYIYDGENKKTDVLYFPSKSITTITTTREQDGLLETEITKSGMTRDEIRKYFASPREQHEMEYDRSLLIRSIIYEAFKKEGVELDEGNVRNFWYTHLKFIITRILGEPDTNSIETTITTSWGRLINSGLITYEGMNILGGKETPRISNVKDSPFNNLIIAVEKVDYFEHFKWIPHLFNCTLITAGGQPSIVVARAFIKQLKDLSVDLNQNFYMCVASDLDPAGYYIQNAFRKQFEAAIEYYGGTGKIEIKRLFVRKDQVSNELLESEAMPCKDKNNNPKAIKAENTKWKSFCDQTDGGIYIPAPVGWNGPIEVINGEPKVRALLEMNAFPKKVIEAAFIRELLQIIEETNDESKIMIPEIMRVFSTMSDGISADVYNEWHRRLIQPLIDHFLSDTNRWGEDIYERYENEYKEAREEKDENSEPINKIYNVFIDKEKEETANSITEEEEQANEEIGIKERDARARVPELYEYEEFLAWRIEELRKEQRETADKISMACDDIFDEIEELETNRDEAIEALELSRDEEIARLDAEQEEELSPIIETFAKEEVEIEKRQKYREDNLRKFKEEHATSFNPIEMALKNDINENLSRLTTAICFRDFERNERFQQHIAKMLTSPNLLVKEGVSCFVHPTPAFVEEDLLKKASTKSDENVENVRNAFPASFLEEMKNHVRSLVTDTIFELKGETPSEDLTNAVNEAMQITESEIEEWGCQQ